MARKSQRRNEPRAEDEVTEAGMESFPASDPPSYNMPGRSVEGNADAPQPAQEGAGRRSGKVSSLELRQRRARHLRRRPRDVDEVAAGEAPTTAALRGQMPSRRTVGKTSAEDPAAAPFDTDDEAAGRPAQASAIEQSMARQNVRVGPSHAPAAPANDPSRTGTAGLIAAIVLIVAALGWLFFG